MTEEKQEKPAPKTVTKMVKLDLYAVQFRDSSGTLRDHFALRNPDGKYFLLDVSPEGPPIPSPLGAPGLEQVEKIKLGKLGPPRMAPPPEWLATAMNESINGKPKKKRGRPPKEKKEEKNESAAMKAATMDEDS